MLRQIVNNKAQAVMSEYILTIFLVVAVIVAMTIYFKRGVQARIHDARDYMVGEVRVRTAGSFTGNLYKEYEPYYTETNAIVDRDIVDTTRLEPGGSSGIFTKIYDQTIDIRLNSQTAPPKDFNATTPTR